MTAREIHQLSGLLHDALNTVEGPAEGSLDTACVRLLDFLAARYELAPPLD